MIRERTTLRFDGNSNLKNYINLIAKENNFSINKTMLILLELGVKNYLEEYHAELFERGNKQNVKN